MEKEKLEKEREKEKNDFFISDNSNYLVADDNIILNTN